MTTQFISQYYLFLIDFSSISEIVIGEFGTGNSTFNDLINHSFRLIFGSAENVQSAEYREQFEINYEQTHKGSTFDTLARVESFVFRYSSRNVL